MSGSTSEAPPAEEDVGTTPGHALVPHLGSLPPVVGVTSNRKEGMSNYRVTIDIHDENVIRFFERYEDEEPLQAHDQTDRFQEFGEQLFDLLGGEPDVIQFEVSEATELDL